MQIHNQAIFPPGAGDPHTVVGWRPDSAKYEHCFEELAAEDIAAPAVTAQESPFQKTETDRRVVLRTPLESKFWCSVGLGHLDGQE